MKYVDTLFCPPSICMPEPENFKKKNYFLTKGPWKYLDHGSLTHLGIKALIAPFQVKMAKMPLVNQELTAGQNWSKTSPK